MTLPHLASLRETYDIPDHVDMVPAGQDYANVPRTRYCAFYEYAFRIGYTLPIYPLAEDLCRWYGACPAQLTPYALKVCRVVSVYATKARKEVTVHHLLQMFNVVFMRGSMLRLRSRGQEKLRGAGG